MQQGFLPFWLRLDVAVLLVGVPCWTRLNSFVLTPDAPITQPVTDAVIVLGYLGPTTWLRRTLWAMH